MDNNQQQPGQLTGEQMDEILQAAMAPWDERSWANLEERYPRTADALAFAVRHGGLTVEGLRDYCERWGYLPEVANWLRQCVLHLRREDAGRRMQAAEVDDDETAALTSRLPNLAPDEDGPSVLTTNGGIASDSVAELEPPDARPSLRLVEPVGRGLRRILEAGEGE